MLLSSEALVTSCRGGMQDGTVNAHKPLAHSNRWHIFSLDALTGRGRTSVYNEAMKCEQTAVTGLCGGCCPVAGPALLLWQCTLPACPSVSLAVSQLLSCCTWDLATHITLSTHLKACVLCLGVRACCPAEGLAQSLRRCMMAACPSSRPLSSTQSQLSMLMRSLQDTRMHGAGLVRGVLAWA